MPLVSVPKGRCLSIKKIDGNDETRRFLNHLGFIEGAAVTVVSESAGNMILKIKESRVGIEKNLVKKIYV